MDRAQTETFIHENFGGILQDWPWDETPDYTVFVMLIIVNGLL